MQAARVNTAIIFGAHFRWDFMPFWTMLHDYMATVAAELGKRGITLFDHHSATLIHRYDDADGLRQVKLHSGPHLPFCPDRRSAAAWRCGGSRLNTWRMIDIQTRKPVWHDRYSAEQFCFARPDFIAAYIDYVRRLVRETGIGGLMSDDHIYFNGFRSCGCTFCRTRFRQRFGYALPAFSNGRFWGNWDNPDWNAYIDLRFDNNGAMLEKVRSALPTPNFPLLSCCSGSSYGACNATAQDIRHFMRGCNLVHLEMCGNTPAWRGDPQIRPISIGQRLILAQHHRALAPHQPQTCIALGYGFTAATAEIVWAIAKFLSASCWFSTLKGRLGLPESILAALPDDATPAARAFAFEEQHPELFDGIPLADAALFFSYETRNHTLFGQCENGYCQEFADTLLALQQQGINTSVILEIPDRPAPCPVLVLPAAMALTETELRRLQHFMAAGGQVLVTGPTPLAPPATTAPRPNRANLFADIATEINPDNFFAGGDASWQRLSPRLLWHPGRARPIIADGFGRLNLRLPLQPIAVVSQTGYYSSLHWHPARNHHTLHLLAADFDTTIDLAQDRLRHHRSRVHCITGCKPKGVETRITIHSATDPVAVAPLSPATPRWHRQGSLIHLDLPADCPCAILQFPHDPSFPRPE